MEKTEGRKQGSSPGSSSRRTYSLFSSIINLSSAPTVKTTDGSSSQQSPHTIPITRTNHQKLSSDAPKKKKSNQSSSPSQSISSPRTGVNGPMGPAPRTLSILTALNELAISDRAGVIDSNPQEQDETKKCVSGKGGKGEESHPVCPASSHIYRRLPPPNHPSLGGRPLLKRDDLPSSPVTLGFSSMPRKLKPDRGVHMNVSPGSASRAKSRERTPDWIWRIFQLAKHGRLEELQKSLKGLDPLDPTLIRHLVDEKGNTLLHCAARRGHIQTLQWLVSILGPHTEPVLNEKNRAGRNVILTALKGGQLKCFQWLVLQSISGDKALVPKEGERSLLHFAANYGNDPAVRWLVEQLKKRNVPTDLKDSGGMTPLHMAAKSGSVSVCHTLIVIAGADPFCQTELGWRPSDLARRHRHMKCANYLMMAEAASSLGSELSSLLSLYKNLQEEHESLRFHFREVLRVGKSLVKERVDLIKNFPSAGSKSSPEAELLLGGTSTNGARLSGLEHKLVIGEQAWKRIEQNQVDKFPPTVASLPSAVSGITNSGGTETPPLDADFTVENINSPNLFQKRLAGLQSRQDKNFASEALLSASSSDAESTASAASSNNDDQPHNRHHQDYHSETRKHGSSSGQSFNLSDSSRATTTAPWLLPPDDTLLSALSPIVSQVDGTVRTPSSSTEFIPSLDLIQKGPSTTAILYNPTGTFGKPAVAKSQGSEMIPPSTTTPHEDKGIREKVVEKVEPPSATVLEVIEPPNKKREDEAGQLLVSSFPSWSGSNRSGCDDALPSTAGGVISGEAQAWGGGGGGRRRGRQGLVVTESLQGPPPPRPPMESPTKRLVGEGPVVGHETMKQSLSSSIEHEKKQSWRNRRRVKSRREDDKSLSSPLPCSSSVVTTKHFLESVYFTPDLIRGTRHKSSHHIKSEELAWSSSPNRPSSSFHNVEDIYGQITAITGDPRSNMRQPHFGPKDASMTSASSPTKGKSWHRSESLVKSSCTTPTKSPSHSLRNSPRVFLQSNPFLLEKLCPEKNHLPESNYSQTKEENMTSSFMCGPLSKSSASTSSIHLEIPNSLPPQLPSKSEEIYGQFSSGNDKIENDMCGETDAISPSAEHGSESVSSLNTPVIKRSLSSVSRVSATLEFPFHKNPWVSTEQLTFTTPESSLGGRISPTPSESSRTESALVPPSHTSQISELSKTESATEHILSHYNLDHCMSNEEQEGESTDMTPSHPEFKQNGFPSFPANDTNDSDYNTREGDDYNEVKVESKSSEVGSKTHEESSLVPTAKVVDNIEGSERDKIVTEAQQQRKGKNPSASADSQIVTAPCITRSGGSTGIHKATIQRVSKSSRGPPKPWYEIEGSDEEGTHLLRVARTSRSSCLSTSSFSETENECTDDDDHTCNLNCSQNNCPNCV
ncbi:unnamed protein product [Allacma fusca]|uniref:Uncharacterized protein n=1 Tax=Allacma fusca TaxID=39272 RepID=A0A8J2PFC7_9HEXA|nr:unnamed protein product [Allacma fusca]